MLPVSRRGRLSRLPISLCNCGIGIPFPLGRLITRGLLLWLLPPICWRHRLVGLPPVGCYDGLRLLLLLPSANRKRRLLWLGRYPRVLGLPFRTALGRIWPAVWRARSLPSLCGRRRGRSSRTSRLASTRLTRGHRYSVLFRRCPSPLDRFRRSLDVPLSLMSFRYSLREPVWNTLRKPLCMPITSM